MKYIILFLILAIVAPAAAQTPPSGQGPEDTIALQNQQIGQLYFQIGSLQQQLNRANATITQLTKPKPPDPSTTADAPK